MHSSMAVLLSTSFSKYAEFLSSPFAYPLFLLFLDDVLSVDVAPAVDDVGLTTAGVVMPGAALSFSSSGTCAIPPACCRYGNV